MQVSRSGYYAYLKRVIYQVDERLILDIKLIAKQSNYSYGSRRMSMALRSKGYAIGRYAARTLMRQAGIECKQRRRYCITTDSKHKRPAAKNVLNRAFDVQQPNCVWVSDITYLWTTEGWLYIAAVLDCFSRRVVGWAIAHHMRETLVLDALAMALSRRDNTGDLLHHSDQGKQYASKNYQTLLNAYGITASMSRKGNCWDNAVMERFWGSLKSERTDDRTYLTRAEAKSDVIDFIIAIGCIPI
jgi:transposase InsO family protein